MPTHLLLLALFEGDPIEDFVVGGFTLASFETATANIPFDCMDPTERERVRDISLRGIDDGLKDAMQHLYTVWYKDPNTEQPKRARVGTVNAINAMSGRASIALEWTPPTCSTGEMTMAIQVLNGPTIAAGDSLSDGLDCSGGKIVKITMPADWTFADITFQTSSDGIVL